MFVQGDIIHLNFTPSAGREMKGPHFGLVVSQSDLNFTGAGQVCPITTGPQELARESGLTTSLMNTGLSTQGIVLVAQARFTDFEARDARKVEHVPDYILNDVLDKLAAIYGF